MKIIIGLQLLLAIIVSLSSCAAELDKSGSAEQSFGSSEISSENKNQIGKFGGEYVFDYHYAQTPDSFFYVNASVNGNKDDGVIRVSKSDFADKALIVSKEAFGVAEVDRLYADVVGVTSKWLYVAVSNTSYLKDVYGLSHDGSIKEKLLENVNSVYFHLGRGSLYFTKNNKDGIGELYSLDLITDVIAEVDTGECEVDGLYWCQLKCERIGFLCYPNSIIVDADGKIDVVQTIPSDETADKCLGRDESLKEKVESFVDEGRELVSYAECGDYIYYIDKDADGTDSALNRIGADGTDKTLLKEETEIIGLYSYEGVLYGDITEGDVAYLVKVSDTGTVTRTEAVTGVGQWGYIKIEDGLFIRTYEVVPSCPSLVYVYNSETGQVIIP